MKDVNLDDQRIIIFRLVLVHLYQTNPCQADVQQQATLTKISDLPCEPIVQLGQYQGTDQIDRCTGDCDDDRGVRSRRCILQDVVQLHTVHNRTKDRTAHDQYLNERSTRLVAGLSLFNYRNDNNSYGKDKEGYSLASRYIWFLDLKPNIDLG